MRTGGLSEELAACVDSIRALREMGATAVRVGSIAVVFDAPAAGPHASWPVKPSDDAQALFDSVDDD